MSHRNTGRRHLGRILALSVMFVPGVALAQINEAPPAETPPAETVTPTPPVKPKLSLADRLHQLAAAAAALKDAGATLKQLKPAAVAAPTPVP